MSGKEVDEPEWDHLVSEDTEQGSCFSGRPRDRRGLMSKEMKVQDGHSGGGCSCCGVLRSLCCMSIAIVLGLAAGYFVLPHEPVWTIDAVRLTDFTPPAQDSPALLVMAFEMTVLVNNPNYLDAIADHGVISVLYQGLEIGQTSLNPLQIGARSSQTVTVKVVVNKASEDTTEKMMAELMQTQGLLKTQAVGTLTARLALLKQVAMKCKATCSTTTSVKALPSLAEKECTYNYAF